MASQANDIQRFWHRFRVAVSNRSEHQSKAFALSFTLYFLLMGALFLHKYGASKVTWVIVITSLFIVTQVVSFIVLDHKKSPEND